MKRKRLNLSLPVEVYAELEQIIEAGEFTGPTQAVVSLISNNAIESPSGMELVLVDRDALMEATDGGRIGVSEAIRELLKFRKAEETKPDMTSENAMIWSLYHICGYTMQMISNLTNRNITKQRVSVILKEQNNVRTNE